MERARFYDRKVTILRVRGDRAQIRWMDHDGPVTYWVSRSELTPVERSRQKPQQRLSDRIDMREVLAHHKALEQCPNCLQGTHEGECED